VLNTLVESAARLCEADMAALARPKGSIYGYDAMFGHSPEHEGRKIEDTQTCSRNSQFLSPRRKIRAGAVAILQRLHCHRILGQSGRNRCVGEVVEAHLNRPLIGSPDAAILEMKDLGDNVNSELISKLHFPYQLS
jgi:hypothetical protein